MPRASTKRSLTPPCLDLVRLLSKLAHPHSQPRPTPPLPSLSSPLHSTCNLLLFWEGQESLDISLPRILRLQSCPHPLRISFLLHIPSLRALSSYTPPLTSISAPHASQHEAASPNCRGPLSHITYNITMSERVCSLSPHSPLSQHDSVGLADLWLFFPSPGVAPSLAQVVLSDRLPRAGCVPHPSSRCCAHLPREHLHRGQH